MKTPCTCNGIEYESTSAACKANGLRIGGVLRAKCLHRGEKLGYWNQGGMHKAGAVAPYVFEWPEEGKC
jgi:hypothetical protein